MTWSACKQLLPSGQFDFHSLEFRLPCTRWTQTRLLEYKMQMFPIWFVNQTMISSWQRAGLGRVGGPSGRSVPRASCDFSLCLDGTCGPLPFKCRPVNILILLGSRIPIHQESRWLGLKTTLRMTAATLWVSRLHPRANGPWIYLACTRAAMPRCSKSQWKMQVGTCPWYSRCACSLPKY